MLAQVLDLSKEFSLKDFFTNIHLKTKCFSSHGKIVIVDMKM